MRAFVLDANVFLQCRKITDLPWHLLSQEEVLLIPAPTAVEEIDRLKTDANPRRARRAREASAIFREVLLADGAKEWLSQGVTVRLEFAPLFEPEDESWLAEIARADERIVEEVLILRRTQQDVRVLSNDTGLCLRARRAGLPFHLVPDDWLIGETDAKQEEIALLRKELADAKADQPILSAGIREAESTGDLVLQFPQYDAIPEEEIALTVSACCDDLLAASEARATQEDDAFEQLLSKQPLSESIAPERAAQLARKRLEATPAGNARRVARTDLRTMKSWREKVDETLKTMADDCNAMARLVAIVVTVVNRGARPALKTRVSVRGVGSVRILNQVQAGSRFGTLASVPPVSREVLAGHVIPSLAKGRILTTKAISKIARSPYAGIRADEAKDQFAWYLAEDSFRNQTPNRVVFGCDDLRHDGSESELEVLVAVEGEAGTTGAIHVDVTAANAATTKVSVPVRFEIEQRDWRPILETLRPLLVPS